MKLKGRTVKLAVVVVLAILVVVALAGGCTAHHAYRVPASSANTSIDELVSADEKRRGEIESHCIERHDEFELAFVELDDQGEFWDRRQIEALEATVEEAGEASGALIVVFVHGWKHNARVCDENVACFREILRALENTEQLTALRHDAAPRRVVGVYVGWRGLSVTPPVLKETSFYGRKATAHRVGRGHLLELFVRLERGRDRLRSAGLTDSKLIVIGHSFGGAVVYSAVAPLFHDRLTRAVLDDGDTGEAGDPAPIAGLGDLVVLVNPAFEAELYSGIEELSRGRKTYAARQPAVLVTVASDTDTATGRAFPLGRFFSTLFERTRDDEQRTRLRRTIGKHEPYVTHRLEKTTARGGGLGDLHEVSASAARGASDCRCRYITADADPDIDPFGDQAGAARDESPSEANEGVFGSTVLERNEGVAPLNPFLVASTSDEVVTQHNGIYNQPFIDFLREFLAEMEKRTRAEVPEPEL